MRHDELLALMTNASPHDWVTVTDPDNYGWTIAALRDDIAVTIRWGRDHNGGEEWAAEPWMKFPDKRVWGQYVDLRYNGVTIASELLVSVDGHRAFLPAGTPIGEEGVGIVGMKATAWEVAVARLVDELAHPASDFDSYLERANIQVAP